MSSKLPRFITDVPRNERPLLIIDKEGILGNALLTALGKGYLTVFVSAKQPQILATSVHIPYGNHIPRIPDNSFAKIIVFYNGEKETMAILRSLAKKRDETGGDLFICLPLSLVTQERLLAIEEKDSKARIVVYGEAFGKDVLEPNQTMAFIRQAHLYRKLLVPNTGLHFVYPMFTDDIVLLLIGILFSVERPRRPLLLFAKHPSTALSVARTIIKQDPSLKLDFYKERSLSEITYIPAGEYVHPTYDLGEALKRSGLLKSTSFAGLSPKQARIPTRRDYKRSMLFVFLLLLLLLSPVLVTLGGASAGGLLLVGSQKDLEQGKLIAARKQAHLAANIFGVVETPAAIFAVIAKGTVLTKPVTNLATTITAGARLAGAETQVIDAGIKLQGIWEERSLDPGNDFLAATTEIKEALVTVADLQTTHALPEYVETKLSGFTKLENIYTSIQGILPYLFGFQGQRQYLVLFQNNMELRPGGGFIGSYATFTMDRGRIENFAIHNVYDADGKLTGHIEPPYPLRRYMQVKHWFLRDSNFDIDFGQDAKQAAQFLKLETGESADVVIGVDVAVLQNFLKATGPVYLTDYGKSVGAKNVYLLTQQQAENNFFPGSTQKQDFLREVFSSLLLRLTDGPSVSYTRLLNQVLTSLTNKHILVAAVDDPTEKLLAVSGLSSSLLDNRPVGQSQVADYVGINEANLGANKANYYVRRSMEQEVAIADNGDETGALTVSYTNASTDKTPFGGDYKMYVRFVLPKEATLESITIDGQGQELVPAVTDPAIYEQSRFKTPTGLEVMITEEGDKKIIGFLLIVPTGGSKQIQVTYTVPHSNLLADNGFTYDLFVLKQPGTESDPYALTLRYPNDMRVVKIEQGGLTDLGGKLVASTNLTSDKRFVVQFSRK